MFELTTHEKNYLNELFRRLVFNLGFRDDLLTTATFADLLAGDNGGGLPDPSGQPDGYALVLRDGVPTWSLLTQDDIGAAFAINSFSGPASAVEVGSTLTNPSFTASYSDLLTSATLDDGSGAISLLTPYTSFAYGSGPLGGKSYHVTAVNATQSWTLAVISAGGIHKTSTRTTQWQPKVYYGVAAAGTYNAGFITGLSTNALAPARQRTIAYNAGASQFCFYGVPSAYGGIPENFIDPSTGLPAGFVKVASGVSITNGFGIVISYDLWKSEQPNLGSFNTQVS